MGEIAEPPEPPEPPVEPRPPEGPFRLFAPARRTLTLWLWAALAGVLAAAATTGFRWLMTQVERLATGHVGGLVEAARSLTPWHRALVCAVGGLLAGLVLALGRTWARRGPQGDGYLDYIDAARQGRVDLNDRLTLARTVSALLSVGTGASIGREGPMVQLSAWLAATLARCLPLAPQQRTTLLVAGIASGIGAAYHAPVAGVVFVLELALGFIVPHAIAPVLIAAATASSLVYWLVEPLPLYRMAAVPLLPTSLGAALLAGLAFGGIGWALLWLLEQARTGFARIPSPTWRLAAGGVAVGGLSAFMPEVWGNGYSVVSQVLQGGLAWQVLGLVLVVKVLATALSSGSGAIGGVFTPSLLVGAAAGSTIAQVAATWLPPEWVGDPRVLAVIGMAAVLSAVTHAPLMAIVMVLEMTNQFQLTVPTMLACGVAYAVSTQFGARPLYGNPIEAHR